MAKKNENGVIDINETLSKSEAFFEKYKKPIIAVLIALVAIIVGWYLYKNYVSEPRKAKASTALALSQENFNNQNFELALNGDSLKSVGLLKIISDFKGTDAANLANLYAGLCYANTDKWEDAIKHLEAFKPRTDKMISPSAVAALGNAYAHVDKLDKAVSKLKEAATLADKQSKEGVNNALSADFLLQAGKILESQGKKDEALKVYKEIKEKYVSAYIVQDQEIEKYIERASR